MRLGIEQKIGSILLVLIAISLAIIGGAYLAFENLHNLADDSARFFLEFAAVAELKVAVDREIAPIRLLFDTEPEKAYDGWQKASEKVDDLLAELKDDPVLVPAERRFVTDIARHQNEIKTLVESLFERSAANPAAPIHLDTVIDALDNHVDAVDTLVDGWREVDEREVKAGVARIDSVHDTERRLMAGSLILLLTGAGIAFVTARSISKPLIELYRGVEKISHGDLNFTVHVKTGDEIEELALAFNRLADNLRQEEETASEIQQRLLPQGKLKAPGVRVHARQTHAKLVGGDWYDYYRIGDEVRLLIADASGKGMPGALLATVGMSAIRSEPKLASTIETILRKTNKTVTNRFGSTDFITLFSAQLSLASRQFVYINCGHEPPVFFNSKRGLWTLLPCHSGLPLGVSTTLFDPAPQRATLNPGDKIILYTDGLHDVRDSEGRFLTMDTIIAWLNDQGNPPIEILTDELLTKATSFNEGPLTDDITLLGIELSSTGT